MSAPVRATIRLLVEHRQGRSVERMIRRTAVAYLRKLHVTGELSVVITTDRRIHALNRRHRNVDRPTDVLSFPGVGGVLVGDVVISLDTARRAATEQRTSVHEELRRYLAHGILHLLGHDHHRRADARRMAAAERKLLGHAGMLTRAE